MKKYRMKEPDGMFYLYDKGNNNGSLVIGGGDISLFKKNRKTESFCNQYSFEYGGVENALTGKYQFTPSRIVIIQME